MLEFMAIMALLGVAGIAEMCLEGRKAPKAKKAAVPVKQWPDRSIPYSQHSALERDALDRQYERECGI